MITDLPPDLPTCLHTYLTSCQPCHKRFVQLGATWSSKEQTSSTLYCKQVESVHSPTGRTRQDKPQVQDTHALHTRVAATFSGDSRCHCDTEGPVLALTARHIDCAGSATGNFSSVHSELDRNTLYNAHAKGKREIPEKSRRPAASSGTIPICENLDVTRLDNNAVSILTKPFGAATCRYENTKRNWSCTFQLRRSSVDGTTINSVATKWREILTSSNGPIAQISRYSLRCPTTEDTNESCRMMPLVCGFPLGFPVSPPFNPAPSSALKTSLLRATQISSFTHLLFLVTNTNGCIPVDVPLQIYVKVTTLRMYNQDRDAPFGFFISSFHVVATGSALRSEAGRDWPGTNVAPNLLLNKPFFVGKYEFANTKLAFALNPVLCPQLRVYTPEAVICGASRVHMLCSQTGRRMGERREAPRSPVAIWIPDIPRCHSGHATTILGSAIFIANKPSLWTTILVLVGSCLSYDYDDNDDDDDDDDDDDVGRRRHQETSVLLLVNSTTKNSMTDGNSSAAYLSSLEVPSSLGRRVWEKGLGEGISNQRTAEGRVD
ncbi:hypothetical protein PR048_004675 [Dryococelus australis]|uniref:Uncharacterized protein n=1 Tax=Dryococelus australis TaxID=614101 RepID=A0ABQ9I629_9NEOP|nr:hypothetical protein PR048_004675 [Dryococelus australis]